MPATAYGSLSRSPPGPWPSHYSSVQFICYFCSSFACILYYVYLMLLVIGSNKVFLIPDTMELGTKGSQMAEQTEIGRISTQYKEDGEEYGHFMRLIGGR